MTRAVQPTAGAIRAANRARVVDVLRRSGSATRAELTARTGLSRATVSSVIGELEGRGLLAEQRNPSPNTFGRPPAEVSLNRAAGLAIAVDIGVRHIAVAVGDLSRSLLTERWTTLPRGHSAHEGTALVIASVDEALREAEVTLEQVVGAAVSIAAPVSPGSGRLLVPGVLPGWNGPELAQRLGEHWDIPVVVENDANLGALAESVSRGGAAHGALLYVKVASRVGLGIALGAHLYRGGEGYAGELGHVTIDPAGPQCWCGRRGCLELVAGGDGMIHRLNRPEITTIPHLIEHAEAGDAHVREVVTEGAEALGRTLANLALVLNPSAIVLGGELAALGDLLGDPLRAQLTKLPFAAPVEVSSATLGARVSLVGALVLVLSEPGRFVDLSWNTPRPADARPADARPAPHQPRAAPAPGPTELFPVTPSTPVTEQGSPT
ncbi:MAG TPA: ROK family transcriptional regulator [Flexivirga sp.]|uniref:ROK family transcriptional regulator n=1 Tax=Flexivirga sp. TaxID=1962927 RepID=UPI002C4FFB10|nr:ROK family transcriptional regulator [Flexivirga sp.]HWC24624.1 ROK family transcriptional regulator [Flexivirga sp.]